MLSSQFATRDLAIRQSTFRVVCHLVASSTFVCLFSLAVIQGQVVVAQDANVAELRKRFEQADFPKRREIAGELVKAGPDSAAYVLPLLFENVKNFRAPEPYIEQAVRQAPENAVPTLMKAILDDTDMQLVAISLLGRHYEASRFEVEKALEHKEVRVRRAAISAVQKAGYKANASAELIVKLLNDPDIEVRHLAAHTTVIFKPELAPTCVKIFESVFDAQKPFEKISIVRLFSREAVKFEHALPMFELAMKDADPMVRLIAARAHFRDVADPSNETVKLPFERTRVVNVMMNVLNDKDPTVRFRAANELKGRGLIDEKTLATVYRDVIGDLDPKLYHRRTAIRKLGEFGHVAAFALPVLRKVFEEDNLISRATAAIAIAHIDPKADHEVMPILIDALTRNTKEISKRPIWLELAKFGPRASSTVPALRALLKPKRARFRASVAIALIQIEEGKNASDYEIVRRYLSLKESSYAGTLEFKALGKLGVPLLNDVDAILKVPNHSRLSAVLRLLEGMGPLAKKTVPALQEQLQAETVSWRRDRLISTLAAIQGESESPKTKEKTGTSE